MLAAQQKLESYSAIKWRRWNTELKWTGTSEYVPIPAITNATFIVERVTFVGNYSGQPTIDWVTGADAQTIVLPDNGATAGDYVGTILPGVLVTGADSTDGFYIRLTGGTITNMRMIVGLRSNRNATGSSSAYTSHLDPYKDNDPLMASLFAFQVFDLQTYANEWVAADNPVSVYPTAFYGVSSATSLTLRTDRIPGSGNMTVKRLTGIITMASAGAVGQTVTISYGFNTASNSLVVPVNGLTSIEFTTGTLTITDTNRDVTASADDFVVTVANSGAIVATYTRVNIASIK